MDEQNFSFIRQRSISFKRCRNFYKERKLSEEVIKKFQIGYVPPNNFFDYLLKKYSLEDIKGTKGTVVMFICNHCPFVKHVNDELVRTANDYRVTGFGFVAINSNDI